MQTVRHTDCYINCSPAEITFKKRGHFQKERSLSKTDLIFKNRDHSQTKKARSIPKGSPTLLSFPGLVHDRTCLCRRMRMLASTWLEVKNVKQRFKRQKSKHERQKDLDGCHEIVKVGESTAISATCDAVLNVFTNSEFTLFPTCVSMDFQSPPSE